MSSPSSTAAYSVLPAQKLLFVAAAQGNIAGIRMALAKGAELEARDRRGRTALIEACRKRRRLAVEYLLGCGADPNHARGRALAMQTAAHDAPIQVAIQRRDEAIALLLLEAGAAKLTLTPGGLTLLQLSKETEMVQLYERLRKLGVPEEPQPLSWWNADLSYRQQTGLPLEQEVRALRVDYYQLATIRRYAAPPAATGARPPRPRFIPDPVLQRLLAPIPLPRPLSLWERFKATMGWGRNS